MAERNVVGDVVSLDHTFDRDGVPTDPTTVTLTITEPSGNDLTPTPTNASQRGLYTYRLSADTAGVYVVTWAGTGIADGVAASRVPVYAASPPTDILTMSEARRAVGIRGGDDGRLDLLALANQAVTAKIDQAAGPVVNRTITAEEHPGGAETIRLKYDPVDSFTTVTEYDSAGTSTTLTLETYSTKPAAGYRPEQTANGTGTYGATLCRRSGSSADTFAAGGTVVVTYVAGRFTATETVSDAFKMSATLTLKNLWRTFETSVAEVGDFDLPFQTFPSRFALPDAAKSIIADELRGVPPAIDDGLVMIG